jgi:hypothetical protein
MQYIHTKYLPPTNNNGGRVKAKASAAPESVTIAYDHSLDVEQAHAKAAMLLANKLDWRGEYAAGGNDTGYVFAFIGNSNLYTTEGA